MEYSAPMDAPLGSHILLDLRGVAPELLDEPEALGRLLAEAARAGGATVVDRCLHRFAPAGVSGVVVLAESHVAVHTWPELGVAAVDVFTCGAPAVARAVAETIVAALSPAEHSARQLPRLPK